MAAHIVARLAASLAAFAALLSAGGTSAQTTASDLAPSSELAAKYERDLTWFLDGALTCRIGLFADVLLYGRTDSALRYNESAEETPLSRLYFGISKSISIGSSLSERAVAASCLGDRETLESIHAQLDAGSPKQDISDFADLADALLALEIAGALGLESDGAADLAARNRTSYPSEALEIYVALIGIQNRIQSAVQSDDFYAYESAFMEYGELLDALEAMARSRSELAGTQPSGEGSHRPPMAGRLGLFHAQIVQIDLLARRFALRPEWTATQNEFHAVVDAEGDEDLRQFAVFLPRNLRAVPDYLLTSSYSEGYVSILDREGSLPAFEMSPFLWARARSALATLAVSSRVVELREPGFVIAPRMEKSLQLCYASRNYRMAGMVIGWKDFPAADHYCIARGQAP